MTEPPVCRFGRDGRLKLPRSAMEALSARSGSRVTVTIRGKEVILAARVVDDPFTDAIETPEPDAFEKMMDAQQGERDRAEKTFDDLMENPPEIDPDEDRDRWR